MRSGVGIFGIVCGLIAIGLVGRYGFKSTDIEADAWIMAFLFGVIATGGLFGHAVSVRLWRHSKTWSCITGMVCGVALILNLSNSLGAIAGRSDVTTTERIAKNRAIRSDETELNRLQTQRDAMLAFVTTDLAAIEAAKRAADTATTAKNAECGNGDPKQRGRFCREKEETEGIAAKALKDAAAAKAATDRATKLEADMRVLRERLAKAGPIVTVNVQGSAIARLFRLPDAEADFVATAQQFGVAVIVELLIVISMVAFEMLGPVPAASTRSEAAARGEKIDATPVSRAAIAFYPDTVPARLPLTPRPKLVAASAEYPADSIPKIMTAALEPAMGKRVELEEAFGAYAAACKTEDKRAVPPGQFVDPLRKFCEAAGIRIRGENGHVYLMNVRLAGNASHSRPNRSHASGNPS